LSAPARQHRGAGYLFSLRFPILSPPVPRAPPPHGYAPLRTRRRPSVRRSTATRAPSIPRVRCAWTTCGHAPLDAPGQHADSPPLRPTLSPPARAAVLRPCAPAPLRPVRRRPATAPPPSPRKARTRPPRAPHAAPARTPHHWQG